MSNPIEHEIYKTDKSKNIYFISRINTTSKSKAWKIFTFQFFSFNEQLEFHAQLN